MMSLPTQDVTIQAFVSSMNRMKPGIPVVYAGHTVDSWGMQIQLFVLDEPDKSYATYPMSWRAAWAVYETRGLI